MEGHAWQSSPLQDLDTPHLVSALKSIGEAVTIVSSDGCIRYANPACERLYGYSTAQLLGKPDSTMLAPTETRIDDETIRASPESTWEGEAIAVRADREEFFARLTVTILDGASAGAGYRVVVHRDVAHYKRMEEQLRQSQRMEATWRLAGGIAHDFNNLLTPIISYAELGSELVPSDMQAHGFLKEIHKAALRASDLTRQLMSFSRPQAIEPKATDLNEIILNMDRMLRRVVSESIELVILPAADLGPVKVDPGQIEQVLVNLTVNARDAMPGGGKLLIESLNVSISRDPDDLHKGVPPGDYVLLAVTDTGVGMTEEVKSRIFEPFYTTKGPSEGTGLGLSTCHAIVTRSGGRITVGSSPGRGTTFGVYLPRVDDEVGPPTRPVEAYRLPEGTETVLLVEDEPMVREVACKILRERGYLVLDASDGHQALSVMNTRGDEPIHLLLTDLVMPVMGGRELADRIRELYPGARVLYTSGYAGDPVVEPGTGFMQKPFTPTQLATRVREVLES